MYYESRLNHLRKIDHLSLNQQARKIKNLNIGQALQIGNVIWVNDANPSGTGITEAAVLYQSKDKTVQFESITVDWCSESDIKVFIREYENTQYLESEYDITALEGITFNNQDELAWFDCGCCGSGFKSTIAKQRQFDQDAGYGICSNCERYYL